MKKIDIGAAVQYGWDSIKKDFWYFVGIAVVYSVLTSVPTFRDDDLGKFGLLGVVLSAWLTAGFLKLVLSYYDGKKLPFSELFTQVKYFWRVLGASILVGLIVLAGFILFIVPGIYLALRLQFTVNLIVDQDLGIIEAMKKSGELTHGVKWSLLLFVLTTIGIIILGAIALGVGIFVAIPIIWLAEIQIYRKLLTAK